MNQEQARFITEKLGGEWYATRVICSPQGVPVGEGDASYLNRTFTTHADIGWVVEQMKKKGLLACFSAFLRYIWVGLEKTDWVIAWWLSLTPEQQGDLIYQFLESEDV